MTRMSVASVMSLALAASATPALAVDCDVNVWEAYNTAKQRGWTFSCQLAPGFTGGFVPYPPPKLAIGCSFKTPPVVVGPVSGVKARLFRKGTGNPPALNNGWSVKSFEVSGGQWSEYDALSGARVGFEAAGTPPPQPNRTYNYVLTKLTLTKSGGSCASAINAAF